MRQISIAPADGFGRLVVVPNVATNLSREVSDGRKDTAGEQLAFDFRKPELDLVQPGRVGRGEMERHVRMIEQKTSGPLGSYGWTDYPQ